MATPLGQLHAALVRAGIPIDGVSMSGSTVNVQFQAGATNAQKAQAAAIVSGADLRPRKPRPVADITSDLQLLNANDFKTIVANVLARMIVSSPGLATDLGIPIPGDQLA